MSKTIERFSQLTSVWLQAVLQANTNVTDLSGTLTGPHRRLYEVWIMPENEQAFSQLALERACYNSVGEVASFFDPKFSSSSDYAKTQQHKLLSAFANYLRHEDTNWHYSVLGTTSGPVVSVVFGNLQAMNIMYERGLRRP